MDILAALLCVVMLFSTFMVLKDEPPLMSKGAWNDLMGITGIAFFIIILFGDVVGN